MRKMPSKLQNNYYLMRHALSIPNERGIIISWPENGKSLVNGLCKEGISQARIAAKNCGLSSETIIYSSDFSSAMQTAQIVADTIGAVNPIASTELGERNFGELEFESDKKYANVWHVDSTGREYGHGVENLVNVANRAIRLIEGIENLHRNKTILLVSHGDNLQAIQAVYQKMHPALDCTKIPFMANAEIRYLGHD